MAEKKALFIDYTWCTGCHSCEMACKVEHNFGEGVYGVKLFEDGPRMLPSGKYEYNYLPVFTSLCDMCAERVGMGKLPTCVHHCQAACMKFGPIDEMKKLAEETPRSWVFVPEQ